MYHIDLDSETAVDCPFEHASQCYTSPHFQSKHAAKAHQDRLNGTYVEPLWSAIPALGAVCLSNPIADYERYVASARCLTSDEWMFEPI
ncbi:hypothetical protein BFL35_14800 [Clavibacter michiganensis]|nr:hypothetical protein BFL35_14800 [Clavibacter michiganensis]